MPWARHDASVLANAAGTRLVLGLVELALLPTQHVYDGPGTSWDWIRRFGGVSAPAAKLSLLAYVLAFAGMALTLRWMTSAHIAPQPSGACLLSCPLRSASYPDPPQMQDRASAKAMD